MRGRDWTWGEGEDWDPWRSVLYMGKKPTFGKIRILQVTGLLMLLTSFDKISKRENIRDASLLSHTTNM